MVVVVVTRARPWVTARNMLVAEIPRLLAKMAVMPEPDTSSTLSASCCSTASMASPATFLIRKLTFEATKSRRRAFNVVVMDTT